MTYHCYPKEKGHKKRHCTCGFKVYKICDCEPKSECWKCDNGLIEQETFLPDDDIMVAHQSFDTEYKGQYLLYSPKAKI